MKIPKPTLDHLVLQDQGKGIQNILKTYFQIQLLENESNCNKLVLNRRGKAKGTDFIDFCCMEAVARAMAPGTLQPIVGRKF